MQQSSASDIVLFAIHIYLDWYYNITKSVIVLQETGNIFICSKNNIQISRIYFEQTVAN